jgi:hypothetical protein
MTMKPVLDFLRVNFGFIVAVVFPLAGVVMAAAKSLEGDRDLGVRLGLASLLGVCIYAVLFV